VIVESDRPGTLEVCMSEITDGPQTSSRRAARNGGPQIFPVMDGQRYSVHAHLETSTGHLETEPLVIVGGSTAQRDQATSGRAENAPLKR